MNTFLDLLTGISLLKDHGRADWLADTSGVGPGDRVLDVGCGPGNGLRAATARGATAIGLDPSPTMLALAARRAPGALLLPASVEAIPLPGDTVDVAWAVGSYHHWPDTAAGLAELHRVLRPGGRVFVVERATTEHSHGPMAKHAITPVRAERLTTDLATAGFVDATVETAQVGRTQFLLVRALREEASERGAVGLAGGQRRE